MSKTEENEKTTRSLRLALEFAKKVAEKNTYELNPNEAQLQNLVRHLADNKAKHGRYFCPCKQHYPLQPENDPVCPCFTFHDEIKDQGYCECHLFYNRDAALQAKSRPGLLADVACPG
jgi:ferredoxin-thioredoxin reductase catalytic subunit